MKNYLFIDTAEGTRALVCYNGAYFYEENLSNAGSETLLPMIDSLLKKAGCELIDMDILGACIGPGSFTGLRIGLTTIKTFCYALEKPCFAVNNLRLNSYNNDSDAVISIADAGNNVCYIAMYEKGEEIDGAKCVTLDGARELVASHPECSVSTDLKLANAFIGKAGVGERELRLAAEAELEHELTHAELTPLYVRKPQPERGEGDL